MKIFKQLSNPEKAKLYRSNYEIWKKHSLETNGYFVIFNGLIESEKLKKISGNALKLYIYLGIHSKNFTGEVWHSNKTISKYFGKSERTVRDWMKELEDLNLIRRMRLKYNGEPHVFLQPYESGDLRQKK